MTNPYMGRILLLDNMIQITEKLKDNYTEYLAKEIVKPWKKNERILIIGGVIVFLKVIINKKGDLKIPNYILTNFREIKEII